MKISVHWLNSYLDRPTDAAEAETVLTNVGFPIDDIEQVGDDTILDVEITSNRPDLLSHVGIAREFAAATGRTCTSPDIALPDAGAADVNTFTSVDNEAAELCPAYTARVITGVKIGPSPDWLRNRLEAVGLRPVNNVVDITNYVLYEFGQPLHAFDLNRLDGRRIVIRHAADKEPFTAIDGSQHQLKPDMLVIADASRPVAIAGVMGGQDSEVTDATTDILLESARFDQLSVRSTSRALRLASDSSYRFERGVDPDGIDRASRRAAQLICELAGGELAEDVIIKGDLEIIEPVVSMRPQRCRDLLGLDVSDADMAHWLEQLGLQPRKVDESIRCTIPSHRLMDLKREIDLIEEVARLHGYADIPIEPKMHIVARPPQPTLQGRGVLSDVLVAHGFHQTITFSFLPPRHAEPFAGDWQIVRVDEEKKKAEPALRPSVLPSLLATRKANQDAGNRSVKLFEIAQVFGSKDGEYVESRRLALLADADDRQHGLRAMRGTLEELFDRLGLTAKLSIHASDAALSWATPFAAIVDEQQRVIGHYGPATSDLLKLFDLQTPVILAELEYDPLIAAYPPTSQVQPLPRFPAIERDLSVIVDESVTWADVERAVHDVKPALMEDVTFVTTYRGKPIVKGRKSVTLRITFRDPTRTLQHDEVTEQVNAVVEKLKSDHGAELRA